MTITHEVNVNVLTKKRQDELNEPLCPPPDVSWTPRTTPRAQLVWTVS